MNTQLVTVIQPWLAEYRVPLFNGLRSELAARDIRLRLVHGVPPHDMRERGDAAALDWAVQVPAATVGIANRSLSWRRPDEATLQSDLVVMEQALKNIDTYILTLRCRGRTAFWGHGRTYTKGHTRLESTAKAWLTRRGSWFFAYTEGGAGHVAAQGFPADRITVVNNTIDETEIRQAQAALKTDTVHAAMEQWSLTAGRTAVFIGGIDPPKRPELLLAVGRRLADQLPGFTLLVAGQGEQRGRLEALAADEPWLRLLGRVDAAHKAVLGAVGDVLLMPGRVGLVAIDSFLLELPIITSQWAYHAPEFDYLEAGNNALVVPDNEDDLVAAAMRVMTDDALGARLRRGCRASAARYSLAGAVRRFAGGIESALSGPT